MSSLLQGWQHAPSLLGRSGVQGAHVAHHTAAAPGHDPFLHSSQAQQQSGIARDEQPSLSNRPPGQLSSRDSQQAEHVSQSSSGASQGELRLHDSSSAAHGPVVHLGEPGDSALGRAGSGLSLSDGDASASVLSSLGEVSEFDADVEHSAEAAELDVPESTGQHLSQRTTADLADAAEDAPAPVPARRSIPSSPFQHEPEPDLPASQTASGAQPPPAGLTGPEALRGSAPGAALQQGLSQLSEQLSEAASAASMHSREPRPIQAASSDLMEAWNEQEQLEKQSNAAFQLHSRLSVEESDLALSDLAELEQASSMLDSMVESAELMPDQDISLGSASRQLFDGQQHISERTAKISLQAEGESISTHATEHGTGHSPQSADEVSRASTITRDTVPAQDLGLHSRQPGSDSSAAQHPSAPSTPPAEDAALTASEVEQVTVDPLNSMPLAEAPRLRPADNAFREGHEPAAVEENSRSSTDKQNGPADDTEPVADHEQAQPSSGPFRGLAPPSKGAAEQGSVQPSFLQVHPDDELPDNAGASDLMPEPPQAAGSHAQPALAEPNQDRHQRILEPVGQHGQAISVPESMPESAAKPSTAAAELGLGADRLAHAEALEMALATGAAPATTPEQSHSTLYHPIMPCIQCKVW